jgi:hypothetical protein
MIDMIGAGKFALLRRVNPLRRFQQAIGRTLSLLALPLDESGRA